MQGWVCKCGGSNPWEVVSSTARPLMGWIIRRFYISLSVLWTCKLITAMLIAYSIFSGPYWSASVENLWLQRAGRTQTGKTATHTLIQIPCLIVTLISALHHRCNYTHSFLLTCWGLPPPPAGDGISCSVGMIIVGISNKKRCPSD